MPGSGLARAETDGEEADAIGEATADVVGVTLSTAGELAQLEAALGLDAPAAVELFAVAGAALVVFAAVPAPSRVVSAL